MAGVLWLGLAWFGKLVSEDLLLALMVAIIPLSGLPAPDQAGIASRFGDPGDRWIGGTLKCVPAEYVNSVDHICAHRRYSCGTVLVVENARTGKRTWCRVMDRGPYGASVFAVHDNGTSRVSIGRKHAWYVKKRRNQRPPSYLCPTGSCVGKWRGIIDLSPAVSNGIGHNGFERVRVWRLRNLIRFYWYHFAKTYKGRRLGA